MMCASFPTHLMKTEVPRHDVVSVVKQLGKNAACPELVECEDMSISSHVH